MKVMLVNPPYISHEYSGWRRAVGVSPPLGLAYIGAVLEKNGCEVTILDANAEGLSTQDTVKKVVNSSSDVIGITSMTTMMPLTYEISKGVKKESDKMIVVGGPHVTFMPEQTLRECRYIDVIVKGEGDITMLELVKNITNLAKVKGITYRGDNGEIITNPIRDPIKNLEEIPYPARHLLPIDLYKSSPIYDIGFSGREYATMMTSRGCPFKCTYCSSTRFWGALRLRSPEDVVAEIEYLVEKYGTRNIRFLDDTLTVSKSRIEKICDLIIEKRLDVKWNCYSHVNVITESIAKKMKASGCHGILFGVESGNQDILNRANKKHTLYQARTAIKITKKCGITAVVSFMIGLPGDNYKTVNQTIDFAIEHSPDIVMFCVTTPFPGTELYDEALEKGWIKKDYGWDAMSIHGSTKFRNDELSSEDIEKLYLKAKRKYYLRPAYILQQLRNIVRNPRELKRNIMGALYLVSE